MGPWQAYSYWPSDSSCRLFSELSAWTDAPELVSGAKVEVPGHGSGRTEGFWGTKPSDTSKAQGGSVTLD